MTAEHVTKPSTPKTAESTSESAIQGLKSSEPSVKAPKPAMKKPVRQKPKKKTAAKATGQPRSSKKSVQSRRPYPRVTLECGFRFDPATHSEMKAAGIPI